MSVLGGPRPSVAYVERQALSRLPATPAAPSNKSSNYAVSMSDPGQGNTNPGDGLVITQLMAISVSVYPWSGATLSGSGNLLCWVYNSYAQQWTRCPSLDIDL